MLHVTHSAAPSHSICMVGHTALGAQQSYPIPPPYLESGEVSSFPGCVQLNGMVNSKSVVSINHGNSGVFIGYQVDEFTHTWSTEHFIAWSHI